jgi:hypothetical protein
MQIDFKKIRLLLRVIGTVSLVLFFVLQVFGGDSLFKNQLLILSSSCFVVVLLYSLITYLIKYYFK